MGITVPEVVMTCDTQTTLVLAVMAAANPATISSADAGQAPSSTRSMPAI